MVKGIAYGAAEVILSRKKIVKHKDSNGSVRTMTTQAWNPTIASLTLISFISNSPSFFLNVIDTGTDASSAAP